MCVCVCVCVCVWTEMFVWWYLLNIVYVFLCVDLTVCVVLIVRAVKPRTSRNLNKY